MTPAMRKRWMVGKIAANLPLRTGAVSATREQKGDVRRRDGSARQKLSTRQRIMRSWVSTMSIRSRRLDQCVRLVVAEPRRRLLRGTLESGRHGALANRFSRVASVCLTLWPAVSTRAAAVRMLLSTGPRRICQQKRLPSLLSPVCWKFAPLRIMLGSVSKLTKKRAQVQFGKPAPVSFPNGTSRNRDNHQVQEMVYQASPLLASHRYRTVVY